MTTSHLEISIKIAELEDTLKSAHPSMPTLLREIHRNLQQDPEIVTLLTSEEVSIIVRGLSAQTNVTITTSIVSGGKGKAMKKMTMDDI